MRACPVCGEGNPARARFCLACGTALPAFPGAESRKVVTVLVAGVGFAEGGEQRDPEAVGPLMARCFDTVRAVASRHGGVVDELIGDAVLAVFGLPRVHEDDALRAVRAAVEVSEEFHRLRADPVTAWAGRLQVRIGVSTGWVVAGGALVTGEAVSVAVRLQQAAEPDGICIAAETFRLVQDAVQVTPAGHLPVDGTGEPLAAYRLRSVTPAVTGRARRSDIAFVGRRHELTLARWAFDRAVREGTCHLLTVLGTAGVGKSRLVREFLTGLEGRAGAFTGRCLPYGEASTFRPVAEVVRQAAGISESDTSTVARDKIQAVLGANPAATRVADRVAELIGLGGQGSVGPDGAWAIRKFLEALARHRPLVVALDDMHWAEPSLLDIVDHVAEWSRDAPILLIAVARPELLDRRERWGGGKLNATCLLLDPLPHDDAATLLAQLLGNAQLDAGTGEHIVAAAGGNPLYLEEMLAMLVEEGSLRRQEGRWLGTVDVSARRVPPTIQALLAARLDLLEPTERAVLERAAVIGEAFDLDEMVQLSPPEDRSDALPRVLGLVRKELVRAEPSRTVGDDCFAFRHPLVREVILASMPKEARAVLHERYAEVLTARTSGPDDRDELVAYHLEQSVHDRAALGPLDAPARARAQRAAQLLSSAGRRAQALGDAPAMSTLLRRSIALRAEDDPECAQLLVDRAGALMETGDFDEADACLRRASALADATGQHGVRTYADLDQMWLRSSVAPEGWAAEARATAERAIAVFTGNDDARGLARAWALLAEVAWQRRSFAEAETALRHARDQAQRAGDMDEVAGHAAVLAFAAADGPCPVSAGIERCRATLERFGDRMWVGPQVLRTLASLHAMRGDAADAARLLADSVERFTDLGQTWWLATTHQVSGQVALLAGDRAAAEADFRAGLDHLQAIGQISHVPAVAALLAVTVAEAGRLDEAASLAALSRRTAADDDVEAQVRWRLASARWRTGQGAAREALAEVDEAVTLARTTDALNLQGEALLAQAGTRVAAGAARDADAALRSALACFELKGNTVAAGWARTALATLQGS